VELVIYYLEMSISYLTDAQCFWSVGTPGRAQRTPSKM